MIWKKTLAVTTACALAISLGACSGSKNDDINKLVSIYSSEPQTPLTPGETNEENGSLILDSLFDGLITYAKDGTIENAAAESITEESDTKYHVTLKDDQTFSDGTPVTANSFVRAWNYSVKNNQINSYYLEPIAGFKPGAEELEGLKVIDDRNFTIELSEPNASFLSRLGMRAFLPLPDSAYDDFAKFGQNPIGNGPYKLQEWNHNQDARVIPNEKYNGPKKPKNDGLRFVFYTSTDAGYADILSNNLDVLKSIPDSALLSYTKELNGRSIKQPAAQSNSISIPADLPHFSGEEGRLRRQAVSLAINRQEIADTVFRGKFEPATAFVSTSMPGYTKGIPGSEVLTFNPEKAKELWAKADAINPWSGEFSLAYNADGGHQAWVDAVVNSLRNVLGIQASGKAYPDFKSFRDDIVNHSINAAFRSGSLPDYPNLEDMMSPSYKSNGSSNDMGYANSEVDALLSQATKAHSTEEAIGFYNKAQEILLQDLPRIPTWDSQLLAAYSDKVDNVNYSWSAVLLPHEITKK